jgi:peptide-methionine (S)-S-oxide reductase
MPQIMTQNSAQNADANPLLKKATLAGGCFWCVEAVFKRLRGVNSVMSGYAGAGSVAPSYEAVSSGATPFAEAIQIGFDPAVISFEKILDVFWAVHDPTTLNRQGNDIGRQYRSVIFYHDAEQKSQAENSVQQLAKSGKYAQKIVTAIEPFSNFFAAEQYHRDYYDQNRSAGYCRLVIDPKIQKLYKDFKADLKEDYLQK